MLKIHHLVLSRSDRIVWLAEELGLKYELVRHVRNAETFRSPDSLWQVAPMGKAPAIQDGDITLGESSAIIKGTPPLDKCPAIVADLARIEARPAYRRALELCK